MTPSLNAPNIEIPVPPIFAESPSVGSGTIRRAIFRDVEDRRLDFSILPRPGGKRWRVYGISNEYLGEIEVRKIRRGNVALYQPVIEERDIRLKDRPLDRTDVSGYRFMHPQEIDSSGALRVAAYRERDVALWIAVSLIVCSVEQLGAYPIVSLVERDPDVVKTGKV